MEHREYHCKQTDVDFDETPNDFICYWGRYRGVKLSQIKDTRFLRVLKNFVQPSWKVILIEKRIMEQENEKPKSN